MFDFWASDISLSRNRGSVSPFQMLYAKFKGLLCTFVGVHACVILGDFLIVVLSVRSVICYLEESYYCLLSIGR